MKILVVGNGGREHALVWKIRQSPLVKEVYCAPGNAGIAEQADCVPIDTSNIVEVADFAQSIKADLTVVGPELPMVLGMGDEFRRRGLSIFCPSRSAAEIEGSKAFAREFMQRHNVPSPRYEICGSADEAKAFVKRAPFGYPVVVKADGLAAGKGTFVAENEAEANEAVASIMTEKKFGTAGAAHRDGGVPARRRGVVPRLLRRLARGADDLGAGPQAAAATATRARTPAAWARSRPRPT